MKVNFNNLRKQAVYAHDRLITKLNGGIVKGKETVYLDEYGWIKRGCVVVDADDIQKDLDDLRMLIGSLACCFEEGNPDHANVYDELFPEGLGKKMESFNEEE